MSTVKQGILSKAREWAKHLRPWGKKEFWGRERQKTKSDINKRLKD